MYKTKMIGSAIAVFMMATGFAHAAPNADASTEMANTKVARADTLNSTTRNTYTQQSTNRYSVQSQATSQAQINDMEAFFEEMTD